MSKALNAAMVDGLAKELSQVDSCVIVGCRDLTVEEVSELRVTLRQQDFRMRVLKNTLASVAFDKSNMTGLGEVLDGPSAVVFGGEGAIPISKVLVEEVKKRGEKLVLHGAFNEGEVMDGNGVVALSKVPGRQELLGMVMGGFFGPVSEMARNMDGLFTEMHGLLEALADKKSEGGEG